MEPEAPGSELGRASQRAGLILGQGHPDLGGGLFGIALETWIVGEAGVDDDGPQRDADPVLEGISGLHDLVDRHLLGEGHERHLASIGVRQQFDDVRGLNPNRARAGRIHETLRRGQERHGVAGSGGVHEDEIGGALALEALDLAENQDVPDARDGGRDDVEGSRGHQALRNPFHPVVGQVLEQRVVGGDPAGPHRPTPGQGLDARNLRLVVAQGTGAAERGRDPGFALELHHEDRKACVSSHSGQSGGDRGLADPTFARYHQDPALPAKGGDVHVWPSVYGPFLVSAKCRTAAPGHLRDAGFARPRRRRPGR